MLKYNNRTPEGEMTKAQSFAKAMADMPKKSQCPSSKAETAPSACAAVAGFGGRTLKNT